MSTTHFASLHPSPPSLPLEIVDLVIQNQCLTSPDLRNTSLVSYVWKEPSQRRLFFSVRLNPEMDHPLYSITPNSASERLIRYIKHLSLFAPQQEQGQWTSGFPCDDAEDALVRIEDDPEWKMANRDDEYFDTSAFIGTKLGCTRLDLVPNYEAVNSTHAGFPAFLQRLTALEMLTVRNKLNFYMLPWKVLQAFFHIFSLDTFRYLDIWRGAGLRLPFIFLHFCHNIEYLSLNAWPTPNLQPEHIGATDHLVLNEKQAVRPTALKVISAEVVHSWSHYVVSDQLGLGNSISLDRLRALYVAYEEDASDVATRGVWPSMYVCGFLSSFGHNLEELVLEVDHRQLIPSQLARIPNPTAGVSVTTSNLSSLTNLTNLHLHIYNGTLPELSFTGGLPWLLLFMKSLPKPSHLTTFQLHYVSTFQWTNEFDNKMRSGEELLDQLFQILGSSFTGLKAVKVQMKLTSLNGPSPNAPPVCDLSRKDGYVGLAVLRERRVRTRFSVVLHSGVDNELQ